MNFGTARILVIVGLVVVGAAILVNGFGHSASPVGATGGVVTQTSTPTTSPPATTSTPTPTTLPPPQQPADVTVAVFNGTSTAGLAAQAQQTLTTAGYVQGQDPANSPVAGTSKTIVYYRGGADAQQNKSDAKSIADQFFSGAKVQLLGADFQSQVTDAVTVTVVLGQDYATANSTGG